METIAVLTHNPMLISLVNMPVFGAILLALIVYRIVSPLIDFLNPLIILTNLGWKLRDALLSVVEPTVKRLWRGGAGPVSMKRIEEIAPVRKNG